MPPAEKKKSTAKATAATKSKGKTKAAAAAKKTTRTKKTTETLPDYYNLVIVESPAKAKTISKFLGSDYIIRASNGHIVDLPKSKMGVDVENNYTPEYIVIRGKSELVRELKKCADKAEKIFLATDPDREGEAISWHISNLLGDNAQKAVRIEFNEITKNAVVGAIESPRHIDENLVNAQQARRVLDRLVGYKLSPFLWHKVKRGLSAGRVQSVAVKIICDREQEILAFVPKEYWTIDATLFNADKTETFIAKYYGDPKKRDIDDEEAVNAILADIQNKPYTVNTVKKSQKRRRSSPPFTTSSLQQEASRKLGFTTSRTMLIAQQLYEGIDIPGQGATGLVTYIRTDSTRVSAEALGAVREYIEREYPDCLPDKPNVYAAKKNAQDAHEAIRPSYLNLTPDHLKDVLSKDQHKLYKLIFERFVASQMKEALYDTVSIDLSVDKHAFKASGSILKFKGYLSVYDNFEESKKEDQLENKNRLPEINEGEVLTAKNILPEQHFTQPPPRYNEASLVKLLEEKGIGRPSTYSPIISTIQERGYVKKEGRNLMPTDLGMIVNDLMKNTFTNIVNIEFTAGLEERLDSIENEGVDWKAVLDNFYKPFDDTLTVAEKTVQRVELPVVESDEVCDKCGAKMVYKEGRFGQFLACPNYPECKNTKAIVKTIDVPCPKCQSRIVIKRSKNKKTFYGCEKYPECDFVTWNMPLNEKCPECGSLLSLHRIGNGRGYKKCMNEECVTNQKKKKDDKES